MKDINLLPREYQRKSPSRFRIALSIILCLSIGPVVKYGFLEPLRIREEKMQLLVSLEAETGRFSGLEEDYGQQQTGLEELQNRVLAFQEMEERSPQYWQDVFRTLVDSLPTGASIRDFTCDDTLIAVSGSCRNDVTSTEYLRNLKSSGYFSDVRMERILYRSGNEISFSLNCTLEAGETGEDPGKAEEGTGETGNDPGKTEGAEP